MGKVAERKNEEGRLRGEKEKVKKVKESEEGAELFTAHRELSGGFLIKVYCLS